MEASVADVTVSTVEPEIVPCEAEMVVVPALTLVAMPPVLILAAAVFEEAQVTELVMFWVD
jgi:hypothetical protein